MRGLLSIGHGRLEIKGNTNTFLFSLERQSAVKQIGREQHDITNSQRQDFPRKFAGTLNNGIIIPMQSQLKTALVGSGGAIRQSQVERTADPARFMNVRSQMAALPHAYIPGALKLPLLRKGFYQLAIGFLEARQIMAKVLANQAGKCAESVFAAVKQVSRRLYPIVQPGLFAFVNRSVPDIIQYCPAQRRVRRSQFGYGFVIDEIKGVRTEAVDVPREVVAINEVLIIEE